jgi:hypothetical protein
MRLKLNDFVAITRKKERWQVPAGMLLTELVAFAGSNFHSAIRLSAEQWELLFRLLFGVTLVWLIKTLINGSRASSVDGFINSLKDKKP